MAKYELKFPEMGEGIKEGTIIEWFHSVGDTIEADEDLLTIATDKVDNGVSSEYEGVLKKMLFSAGDVVQVGQTLAILEVAEGVLLEEEDVPLVLDEDFEIEAEAAAEQIDQEMNQVVKQTQESHQGLPNLSGEDCFYSPLVKSIIIAERITEKELSTIKGTGLDGRLTKTDLKKYLAKRPQPQTKPKKIPTKQRETTENKRTELPRGEADELITLSRMGKMISDHMLHSKTKAAHVQSFIEVDVTDIVQWRSQHKIPFREKTGQKLTFTPIFMMAVAKVLASNPLLNIAFDGVDKVVKYQSVNLGMATALPDGNLIVPIIANADQLGLVAMATHINDLAKRAKESNLQASEVYGGTYTITNVGAFGTVFGTPIISQPQSAILAIGAIRKMPRVITVDGVDTIAIRHTMYLSHSYDHRVVNGALGGIFIKEVKDFLEGWLANEEAMGY